MTELKEKENKNKFSVLRVDKGIIANIDALESAFGDDAQLAIDIMMFIKEKLTTDLFGTISFTLKDFCKFSGYNRVNLAAIHHDIQGKKIKLRNVTDPETKIEFTQVFDYTLYKMLTKAIVISNRKYYEDSYTDTLKAFLIFSQLEITNYHNRKEKEPKLYNIRINHLIQMNLFKNFYILEKEGFFKVGKGKGGMERKKLYIVLCWKAHQFATLNKNKPYLFEWSVDEWVKKGGFFKSKNSDNIKLPKHKKELIKDRFNLILKHGNLKFNYYFDKYKHDSEDYKVVVDFHGDTIQEFRNSPLGKFKSAVFKNLAIDYSIKYNSELDKEKDSIEFQKWLTSFEIDLNIKLTAIINASKQILNKNITPTDAKSILYNGLDEIE